MVATVGSQKAASAAAVHAPDAAADAKFQAGVTSPSYIPLLDLLVWPRGTLAPAFAELFVQFSRRCYVVLKSAAMHALLTLNFRSLW